jgi:hypothetical protein
MFEKLITSERIGQTHNLISQVVKILEEETSNTTTSKFISQMKIGNVFDAVYNGKTPEGKKILSIQGNKVVVELPKTVSSKKQSGDSTRAPLVKGQTIRVRVETSWPKPSLKIIQSQLRLDKIDNPDTRTVLTHRAKSISTLYNIKKLSQTPDFEEIPQVIGPPKHKVRSFISPILDSNSNVIVSGNRSIKVPAKNSNPQKPLENANISLNKTVEEERSILLNTNTTTNTKRVDIKTIIPYMPTRMPIVKLAHLLADKILDSPMIQELNVKPDLVSKLRDTLYLLLPREGEIPSEGQVRKQIEVSGFNYEAKVRQALELGLPINKELASNLKGILLELFQSTDKLQQSVKNSGPLNEFRQTLKFAIDNIELNQLSSQISKQENQPLVIQIPNPLTTGNKTIQLYIRKDSEGEESKNKDKKNSHNVAFFLDLSFLGKIKINAQISHERLSIKIDVENQDIENFINNKTQEFKEKMREDNFETSVECHVNDQVKPPKDSLIEMLISHNTSLVNIKT